MNNIYEKNWKGLWTLEWNEVQQKFHIETADTRFSGNVDSFLKGDVSEWYTLGIFNSYKEASDSAENLSTYKSNRVVC